MHNYLICGLHISCEFELPGAILVASQVTVPDVSIRRGTVSSALDGAAASGPSWEMAEEMFLLRVPQVACVRITAGRNVVVDIEPGVADHDAAGIVLGT